jgi:putative endonuclease
LPNLRGVGRAAEDRAAEFLIGQGFTIVTRRYSSRSGELDLVALDGDILVIVEVKARRAEGLAPEESIPPLKAQRLLAAAREYLESVGEASREIRFDVIAIDRAGLRHIRNALEI